MKMRYTKVICDMHRKLCEIHLRDEYHFEDNHIIKI